MSSLLFSQGNSESLTTALSECFQLRKVFFPKRDLGADWPANAETSMVQAGMVNHGDAVGRECADSSERQVRIVVVAATNRPEDCDPALVRRFGVRVMVGLPTLPDRKNIVRNTQSNSVIVFVPLIYFKI